MFNCLHKYLSLYADEWQVDYVKLHSMTIATMKIATQTSVSIQTCRLFPIHNLTCCTFIEQFEYCSSQV